LGVEARISETEEEAARDRQVCTGEEQKGRGVKRWSLLNDSINATVLRIATHQRR